MSDCLEKKKDVESGGASLTPFKRKLDKAIALKCASLVALILQNAGAVLLTRHYATRPGREPFLKTAAVLTGEFIKLSISVVCYFAFGHGWEKSTAGLRYHLIDDWRGLLKTGVASATFFAQSVLFYVGTENLNVGTFMLTSQSRILATAIFAVLLLKRKLSVVQWSSLVVLCVGIGAVQVSTANDCKPDVSLTNATKHTFLNATPSIGSWPHAGKIALHENQLIGLMAVLVASTLSGFSGAYVEKILKTTDVGLFMQNIRLSLMTIPIAFFAVIVMDGKSILDHGFFRGFDSVSWSVVTVQAVGGLLVSAVIKYADNILKCFALSGPILLASTASAFIRLTLPSVWFCAEALLVVFAIVAYGLFPHSPKKPPNELTTLNFAPSTPPPAYESVTTCVVNIDLPPRYDSLYPPASGIYNGTTILLNPTEERDGSSELLVTFMPPEGETEQSHSRKRVAGIVFFCFWVMLLMATIWLTIWL